MLQKCQLLFNHRTAEVSNKVLRAEFHYMN